MKITIHIHLIIKLVKACRQVSCLTGLNEDRACVRVLCPCSVALLKLALILVLLGTCELAKLEIMCNCECSCTCRPNYLQPWWTDRLWWSTRRSCIFPGRARLQFLPLRNKVLREIETTPVDSQQGETI